MKMDAFAGIKNQFVDPPATYRPQPFWFLNHDYKQEELVWQLDEMKKKGVGGVVLHSRHGKTVEYMSREYLDMLAFCVDECKKRGMVVWLYDEDNWPSGTFGGKLTRQHPEYRMRYLRMEESRHVGGEEAVLVNFQQEENNELIAILAYRVLRQDGEAVILEKSPTDVTNLLGQYWIPPSKGEYIMLACWECEIAEKVTFGAGYYLDTMNQEAVQAFVQAGYEPFLELQDEFGGTIQGIFTDEPGLMIHDGFFGTSAIRTNVQKLNGNLSGYVLGWTRNLLTRFEAEMGYSLRPLLGGLLYELEDASHKVREHYYSALTNWYVSAYHSTLSQWCDTRGLAYIGHTLEEPLWGQARSQGNQTMVLQQFHYPGVDYLTKGIGTKENPYRILSVKCASSVARLEGKPRVICEAFGASDHSYSMRDRRKDANFMAFLGVNLFIPHAFYYSFEGYRKTDFPQTEFYHAPHWEHYREFSDYIARLSMLGSLGEQVSNILLVSPIHTVYQEMFHDGKDYMQLPVDEMFSFLSDRIIRNRLNYDYVDECQLAEGVSALGEMYFPKCEEGFSTVILPSMKVMGVKTAERLLEFVMSGGTLIAIEEIPVHSALITNDPELSAYTEKLFPNRNPESGWQECGNGKTLFMTTEQIHSDDAAGLCRQIREIGTGIDLSERWMIPQDGAEHVVMTGRRLSNQLYTWIFNGSECPVELQYDAKSGESLEEWELETGDIRLLSEQEIQHFQIAPGQMRIVVPVSAVHSSYDTALPIRSEIQHTIELSPEWNFQLEDPNVLILDRWEVTLNDRQARIAAKMPGQVNTFRKKIRVESSLVEALTTKGTVSDLKDRWKNGLYLVLDDLQQTIQSHIGFLSRRRSVEIFVNGERLPALEPAQWQDRFYHWVDISSCLREGDNEIEILTFSLLEPMPGFAYPAFLIGEFGLTETESLTVPEACLSGCWTESGYPHLSGKALYSQTFDWTPVKIAGKGDGSEISVELHVEDIKETARLRLNGEDAGVRLWPPYKWEVTNLLLPGMNKIELQVANTLENIYGKHNLASGIDGRAKLEVYKIKNNDKVK
jgi:hypothetical protein